MSDIRVVVVDDQRLIRSGLCQMLSMEADIAVVGEASNGQEAMEVIAALRPNVVVMDVRMPVLSGVIATQRLRMQWPDIQVLLLTTFDNDEYLFEGLKAGAIGYLLKDVEDDELIEAIRDAAQGKSTLHAAVTTKLINEYARLAQTAPSPAQPLKNPLSEREVEILRLIADGRSNRTIADALHHTEGTVKQYVKAITTKLGARDRTHAAILGRELGVI